MNAQLAAQLFAALIAVVVIFQLSLAAGAPFGRYAMGGAHAGVFPPRLRVAAVVNAVVLALTAIVVLSRAGVILPAWRTTADWVVWPVAGLFAVGVILNLITPSKVERAIWAPVATALLATALVVALSP
jgi:hypothetical protein